MSLIRCSNESGSELLLCDYGATVVSLKVPDREGNVDNVVLGFASEEEYRQDHPFFGGTVGRFCNRIARGQFSIGEETYQLATNSGEHHLHGGVRGFDKRVWDFECFSDETGEGVVFTLESPEGEEGYPGNLNVSATYFLTHKNELRIEFSALTDAATPVNLTNHCYWNLAGAGSGSVMQHELWLAATHVLSVDSSLIPTGEQLSVVGTPYDFSHRRPIGREYDHCFVHTPLGGGDLSHVATLISPESGRGMDVFTTQPGVQVYTGNGLDGSQNNGGFSAYGGVCLETQNFPDAPNQPTFPTSILLPGETFREQTKYRFFTINAQGVLSHRE